MSLIHGGQLQQVAQQYKIPTSDWLDLSTGIAPISYPIPEIPLTTWQQLPQQSPALMLAAKSYYQCAKLLITNGSQAIIKSLPELYRQKNPHGLNVYLPERGYKEHAKAWQLAGYQLTFYQDNLPEITTLPENAVVVIINPNNPTGKFFSRNVISQYHQTLQALNGLLVLDEAFMDVFEAQHSYSSQVADQHCLVLRSFGKFFGLAGIRIGFLIASQAWQQIFQELLGPWQVNGPAQFIAEKALKDRHWHSRQKERLQHLRQNQEQLLWQVFTKNLVTQIKGCDLFLTLDFHHHGVAKKLYHLLCVQGVYCRLADEQDTLRFGIANEHDIERLNSACLSAITQLGLLK